MKKKWHLGMMGLLALTALSSCGGAEPSPETSSNEEIYAVYEAYKANGGELSYEDWLASIKGEKGDKGDKGADGYSLLTGRGEPSSSLGKDGDSYIDLDTYDYYVRTNGSWGKEGNIKGKDGSGQGGSSSGKSAYELYRENNPDYEGSEEQWLEDLASGKLSKLTITFDTDGGTPISPVSISGNSFLTVDPPTKGGYQFCYWELNGAEIDLRTYVFHASCTLKAKWWAIPYTIDYVTNGGANDSDNPRGYYAYYEDFALKEPIKAGYEFKGWYAEPSFVNKVSVIKKGSYGDLTLYAKWEEITSRINSPIIKTPTTIEFWHPLDSSSSDFLTSCIEEFKEEEPNVIVEARSYRNYSDLYYGTVRNNVVGNFPDLVLNYPGYIAEMFDQAYGQPVDLDPYMSSVGYGWSDEEKSDFHANMLALGGEYAKEGTYSIPYNVTTECLYYNADALLGLDLSSFDSTINGGKALDASYLDNLTWEELFEKLSPALESYNDSLSSEAKILKEGSESIIAFNSESNLFLNLAKQYGIGYTSVDKQTGEPSFDFLKGEDKQKMQTLLKKWAGYAEKGYLVSTRSMDSYSYADTYFANQESLFCVAFPSQKNYITQSATFNLGEAKMPHAEGRGQYSYASGAHLAMLNHDNHNRRVATWIFMKKFFEKSATLERSKDYGIIDIHKSSEAKSLYQNRTDVVSSLFSYPSFKGSTTALNQAYTIMGNVIASPGEVDENIDSWFDSAYQACVGTSN